MVKRNPDMAQLKAGYLFPEINRKKRAFLEKNPTAKLISLGIGDTTLPIPEKISDAFIQKAKALTTFEGYTGYGDEQGEPELRKKISEVLYKSRVEPSEIFVSDGSKCDIGRLQTLFGDEVTVAIQDPSYPVYVDSSLIIGQPQIVYMEGTKENGFFPNLKKTPRTDLIYFCSPNNPTGQAATFSQLQELVNFAKENQSILIFDAAYASFIRDPDCPSSIYEIPGAKEVAIELGSFSKMAGFTGVRLGWSVVPKTILFDDGFAVHTDWNRINTTLFNGASNIAQAGGLAALTPQGLASIESLTDAYMENASKLKTVLELFGLTVFGGKNTPYLFVEFPGKTSWEAFEFLLEECHIISTPGSGFGKGGEGFLRLSTFCKKSDLEEALLRLKDKLQLIKKF